MELGRIAVREAVERAEIDPQEIDEVVVGNIAGPPDVANIARVIALHDCDIRDYDRVLLARLCFPIANPNLSYEFAKGYYSRVTDRLYGRVTRLFMTPLLRAMKSVLGPIPGLLTDRYLGTERARVRSRARRQSSSRRSRRPNRRRRSRLAGRHLQPYLCDNLLCHDSLLLT